jgi:hypothetical protein
MSTSIPTSSPRAARSSEAPRAVLIAVSAAALLVGCLGPDTVAPPPPSVDPVRTPTSLRTQILTGSAEYGSRLVIAREPELSDGPIETTADPFTALWSAEVSLASGVANQFTIVAIDAAGNRSPATEIVIVHEPPVAHAVTVVLDPPLVNESFGVMEATARLLHPEDGVALAGQEVQFALQLVPAGGVGVPVDMAATGTSDAEGRARATFEDLYIVGEGTVRATAPGGADAQAAFLVHGETAGPVSLTLELEAEVDGSNVGPTDVLAVPAGTPVQARVEMRDLSGNIVDRLAVITTDAPGAEVTGDRIEGLERAGVWTVSAITPGTGLVASATLEVTPGPPAEVHLDLAHRSLPLGVPLPYGVRVEDAYRNPVAWPVSVTTDPAGSEVDTEEMLIRFAAAGEYAVTAEADVEGAAVGDTRSVIVVDGETGSGTGSAAIVMPGPGMFTGTTARTMQARIMASASSGLAEVRMQIRGPGISVDTWELLSGEPQSAEVISSFAVPSGDAGDEIALVAAAVDVNGKITVSEPVVVGRRSSPTVYAGYYLREVAGGAGSLLSSPRGVTMLADGRALVTNGNDRLVAVDLSTGDETHFGDALPGEGWDVVALPGGGDVFASYSDGVRRLAQDGSVVTGTWLSSDGNPRGLAFGTGALLYVTSMDDDRVYAFETTEAGPLGWGSADRQSRFDCGGALDEPWGVVHSAEESTPDVRVTYVSRHQNSRVLRCTDDGTGGSQTGTQVFNGGDLSRPRHMALVGDRDILVTSRDNGRILRGTFSGGSWVLGRALEGLQNPYGLWRVGGGRFLFTDEGDDMLYELMVQEAP